MRKREWLVAVVFGIFGALSPGAAQGPIWYSKLGDAPGETILRDTMNTQLVSENRLAAVCKTQQQIDRNACQ